MSKVARALGIGRSTLYRKLRDYGLEGDFKATRPSIRSGNRSVSVALRHIAITKR